MAVPLDLDQIDLTLLNQDGRIGKGLAELVTKQKDCGEGLMNVSKLMDIMNNAGASSGAEVQHKMRSEDGTLVFDADEKDVERCNFEMQMAQLARMVEHLPRGEKLAFSQQMRIQGNEKFKSLDYESATELYMQSLVGLDFACALKLRKFHRCILLADYAIKLDPNAWKALSRKGTALLELGDFFDARQCLREASVIVKDKEEDLRGIRLELKRLNDYEKLTKLATEKHRKALSSAMNSGDKCLYNDKKKKLVSSISSSVPPPQPLDSTSIRRRHQKTPSTSTSESSIQETVTPIQKNQKEDEIKVDAVSANRVMDLNQNMELSDRSDDGYAFSMESIPLPVRVLVLALVVVALSHVL